MAEQVETYDDNSGLSLPDGGIISDPWLYMPVDRAGRRVATFRASDDYGLTPRSRECIQEFIDTPGLVR